MADEVEMTPVEAVEPPKADPLAKPAAPKVPTLKLAPGIRKPAVGGTQTAALKPGLKLPPKPGLATAGLKLPPKPGVGPAGALKPGLKLPTQNALKPGIKLPPKPVIRKPGATVTAAPLPKPVAAPAVTPAAPASAAAAPDASAAAPAPAAAPAQAAAPAPAVKLPPRPVIRKPGATVTAAPLPKPVAPVAAPAAAAAPAAPAVQKPVAVDAQGVGKLPTVEAKAVARDDTTPVVSENKKPLEALKSVTQKLKGITQEIPQQAILRKTGIIADGAMSEAQKEAAKHKTARISLSDAMGVAPVKEENAPMKTIRIKRPVGIPGATASLKPIAPAASSAEAGDAKAAEGAADESSTTITQRKTLKIARPGGGAVRPSGKFGIKRPSQASTALKKPAEAGDGAAGNGAAAGDGAVADIPDIPDLPMAPVPAARAADNGPTWAWTLSSLVQAAACVAMGVLAWLLYQNTQTAYF